MILKIYVITVIIALISLIMVSNKLRYVETVLSEEGYDVTNDYLGDIIACFIPFENISFGIENFETMFTSYEELDYAIDRIKEDIDKEV